MSSTNVLFITDFTGKPPTSGIVNRRALYPTTPEGVTHRHRYVLHEDRYHGMEMECPACTAPGFLDLDTPVGQEVKDGAVWYNPYCGWECTECQYK